MRIVQCLVFVSLMVSSCVFAAVPTDLHPISQWPVAVTSTHEVLLHGILQPVDFGPGGSKISDFTITTDHGAVDVIFDAGVANQAAKLVGKDVLGFAIPAEVILPFAPGRAPVYYMYLVEENLEMTPPGFN